MSACAQDERLIELVYDELPGDERAELERHVRDCEACGAELARLGGTVKAFSGLADAEPPAAVRAALLEEAARADHVNAAARPEAEAAGGAGLWARFVDRWLGPAMRHPALAAAATLVVILGVAGALRLQGGSMAVEQIAEPAAAPEGEAELASADDEAVESPRRESLAEALEEAPEPAPEAALADEPDVDMEEEAADDAARTRAPQRRASSTARSQRDSSLERSGGAVGDVVGGAPAVGGAETDSPARSRERAPAEREAEPERRFAEPPPPAPAPEQQRRARVAESEPAPRRAEADAEDRDDAARGDAREAWLRDVTERMAEAARDGRCGDAAALANDVRERAPAYYRERVEGASVLARCREAIEAERERRARDRDRGDE